MRWNIPYADEQKTPYWGPVSSTLKQVPLSVPNAGCVGGQRANCGAAGVKKTISFQVVRSAMSTILGQSR